MLKIATLIKKQLILLLLVMTITIISAPTAQARDNIIESEASQDEFSAYRDEVVKAIQNALVIPGDLVERHYKVYFEIDPQGELQNVKTIKPSIDPGYDAVCRLALAEAEWGKPPQNSTLKFKYTFNYKSPKTKKREVDPELAAILAEAKAARGEKTSSSNVGEPEIKSASLVDVTKVNTRASSTNSLPSVDEIMANSQNSASNSKKLYGTEEFLIQKLFQDLKRKNDLSQIESCKVSFKINQRRGKVYALKVKTKPRKFSHLIYRLRKQIRAYDLTEFEAMDIKKVKFSFDQNQVLE